MPIKVRCPDCSKVMGVPDKAAGRAVKCKGCGGRVPVPASGSSSGAPKKKKRKKKRPAPQPSFDDYGEDDYGAAGGDVFGGLNLGMAEDQDRLVCPKCTKPVDEEDFECPHCGVNIETGGLSETQRKRRARKGPPPEEFYGAVWSDAWQFLMDHKGFAVKTGLNWGFSLSIVVVSCFVLAWYIPGRAQELRSTASDNVQFHPNGVLIQPADGEVVIYDNVRYGTGSARLRDGRLVLPTPEKAAILSPPTFFWVFMASIFFLGCTGWAWALSAEVVKTTMAKQKKIKRFHGDIYKNMMQGFKTIFWPVVLMYPVVWVPGVVAFFGSPLVGGGLGLGFFLLPLIFLPIAVVHMAQPYTYRAWLINWMGKDLLNTIGPSLFVAALFFGLVMLLPLGIAGGVAAGWNHITNFYYTSIEVPVVGSMFSDIDTSSAAFAFGRLPLLFVISWLTLTLIGILVAFPAVYMMRIFGLFGLYFRPDLSLCAEQPPLSDAGFGPRFLAFLVDSVITQLLSIACFVVALIASKLFGFLYGSYATELFIQRVGTPILTGLATLFYYAKWESGSGRATLGKWSLGLLVVREDNEPMSMGQAVKRTLMAWVSAILLYIPFIICAFHPKHRAMHDSVTKTKVVWRGDEEM